MSNQLSVMGEERMTVSEVSSILKIDSRTLRNYISKLFPDLMKHGVTTYLDERQVTLLKLEIQRNQHLERSFQVPQTKLERTLLIQQAMNLLVEEVDELNARLEEARPKVEFYDQVADADGCYSNQEAPKVLKLGYGRTTFCQQLREMGIYNGYNIPYQAFIDRGYFKVVTKLIKNDSETRSTALVTNKGITWLQKKLKLRIA